MGIQFPWFLREVQEGYAAKGGQQNNKAYQFATSVPEAILWSDKNITIRHDSEIWLFAVSIPMLSLLDEFLEMTQIHVD